MGHALRNAAVPIVTVIGIGVALLIGGVVVTESVFAIPGLGRLTVDAILRRDYPVIQGIILVFSGAYVVVNLVVDMLYTVLDPADQVLSHDGRRGDRSVSVDAAGAHAASCAFVRRHPTVAIGGALLLAIVLASIAAPWLGTVDPISINPSQRLRDPSADHWFGTDRFGRDLYSRVIYGGRVSLIVGLSVAALATLIGLAIGLVSGYLRAVDAVVMRVMDGMMAIPAIMLAIALIALSKASIVIVIVAVTLPEIPRVVRLVRSIVLTIREQPYIEAATAIGTSVPRIMLRHLLPNALPPLIVQATYICASAVLIEAALSFLGAGTPPEIPSWGNIMAEARPYFQLKPWMVLLPGVFLAVTVLAINLVGDGLRDMLDPRLARAACDERVSHGPCAVTRSAHALLHARRRGQGGRRRVAVARPRRNAGGRRRERMRQVGHRAVDHAPRAAGFGPHRVRQRPLRRQGIADAANRLRCARSAAIGSA